MRFAALFTAALMAAFTFFAPARAADVTEPFTQLAQSGNTSLSGSGRFVATVRNNTKPGDSDLLIFDFAGGGTPKVRVLPFPGVDIIGIAWKGDERMLLMLRQRDVTIQDIPGLNQDDFNIDAVRATFMNPDGTAIVGAFSDRQEFFKGSLQHSLVSALPNDPAHVLIGVRAGAGVDLYKINVNDGSSELVERANAEAVSGPRGFRGGVVTVDWEADINGTPYLRFDIDTARSRVNVLGRPIGSRTWSRVFQYDSIQGAPNQFEAVGLAPGGQSFFAVGRVTGDKRALYELSLSDGSVVRQVYADPRNDLLRASYSSLTGTLLGVVTLYDAPRSIYFDETMAALQREVDAALPGMNNTIVASTRDRTRLVIASSTPSSPPKLHWLDMTAGDMAAFLDVYPEARKVSLGETRSVTYASKDGKQILAFVTTPPGGGRNLPTVIVPHGGPEARDVMGYDAIFVQFLAVNGYVVIQPQFRGSDGFGRAFAESGYRQWGNLILDDIAAGIDWGVAEGITDPDRVCIYGWSFGGYAALASAAFRGERYKCAVGGAGVYDLALFQQSRIKNASRESGVAVYWAKQMGDVGRELEIVNAAAPAKHAAQITIPILLIHGDKDEVVPIDQGDAMEKALKAAGGNVRYIKIEGETHNIEMRSTRRTMMTEILAFMNAHIGR